MAFIVVLDACVLYPASLRDILLRLAEVEMYDVRWSQRILDRHVLAAAVLAGAQHVITSNLSDFPPEATHPHGVEAVHPDDFLLAMLDLDAELVLWALARQAADLKDPPMTRDEVLDALAATVPRFVARAREVVDESDS